MKKLLLVSLFFNLVFAGLAADVSTFGLIPFPEEMKFLSGSFQLTHTTRIYSNVEAVSVANYLAQTLRPATAFPLSVERTGEPSPTNGIWLTTAGANTNLGPEGYTLVVSPTGIIMRAQSTAGLFYGAQTLRQLLPAKIFATNPIQNVAWTVPGVQIQDQPRYAWRGLMLDVSRHFFTKKEIEQVLDAMALLKLNTFHWHLTDDQGWRVEIKKYPQLTREAAWRRDIGFGLDPKTSAAYGPDGRYGGFYTQDDIREVVAYAQSRFITIVPEIEMPGHSLAALSVFPELSCLGESTKTNSLGRPHSGVYCAGSEETFVFLQNVLTEIMDLFPGKYIHIGGDEVSMDNWRTCWRCQARMKAEGLENVDELQSYFIRRIGKFIEARGRSLIGWSDIRKGGLATDATVMDWIGGATEAATTGHDVVMTPKAYCYFDYYQSQDHSTEPRAIGNFLPLEKVYAFEPVPEDLAPQFQPHILGAEGVVWTAYIPNLKQAEFMMFPRLNALAEVLWSPKSVRNFDDFQLRLKKQNQRLELAGINYRHDTSVQIGSWTPAQINSTGMTLEWDVTPHISAAGLHTITFNAITGTNGLDIVWAALLENGREISRDEHVGYSGDIPPDPSNPSDPVYTLNVPEPKVGAHYMLRARVAGSGGTDSCGNVNWSLKPTP